MRQVFLDTETTGLSAEAGDRLVEIGCVELVHRKRTGHNQHFYLNPGRDSHPDALKVHGLSTEFLSDKPPFAQIADDLLAYLKDAQVFIHNAAFDVGFLNMELALMGRAPFASHVAGINDTLAMAKEMFPGKRNSLDALCDRLGVDNSHRVLHGALLDADLLAQVYICLTRGQDALLMDAAVGGPSSADVAPLDLSHLDLPVLYASASELAAHQDVLVQIDQASRDKTLWRRLA
jgi:DNA polymerase-3 subunit epsilon